MTAAKLYLAQAATGQKQTKVTKRPAELSTVDQTFHRYGNAKGALRPDEAKPLRVPTAQAARHSGRLAQDSELGASAKP